jgi:hypothetical protein
MTPPTQSPEASGSQPPAPWLLFTESARGAAHILLGLPNQDSQESLEFEISDRRGIVAAVADGHGNRRHFRSGFGSRFAVDAAAACVVRVCSSDEIDWTTPEAAVQAKDELIPSVLDSWRMAVSDHLSSFPFSPEEESLRRPGDDPEIAYGSTLLLVVWTTRWVLCVQIGDGDVLAMHDDGRVVVPVPGDPNIQGHRTTSLCQPDALRSFRYGIVDSSPLALLLASDGYANSQVAQPWQPEVGGDIVNLLRTNGSAWVGEELKSWVARCASDEGSGDDTTVTLVIRNTGDPPS